MRNIFETKSTKIRCACLLKNSQVKVVTLLRSTGMENGSNNIMADFDETPNVVVLSDSERPLLGERERPPKDRLAEEDLFYFLANCLPILIG